jgi:hypothetical protein
VRVRLRIVRACVLGLCVAIRFLVLGHT